MRPDFKNLSGNSLEIDSTCEGEGLKQIRISVGTFAGTEERVFVVNNSRMHAFDTGDQGGGQN